MIKGAIIGVALVLGSAGYGKAPCGQDIEPEQKATAKTTTLFPRVEITTKKRADKTAQKPKTEENGSIDANGYGWIQLQYTAEYHIMENHLTKRNGVVYCFGHKETWYSTNEAAGKTTAKEIPDKHVADDGTIRDEKGYICVASSDLPFYSIVMTSVGPGKVYDTGCSSGTIDVYTNW